MLQCKCKISNAFSHALCTVSGSQQVVQQDRDCSPEVEGVLLFPQGYHSPVTKRKGKWKKLPLKKWGILELLSETQRKGSGWVSSTKSGALRCSSSTLQQALLGRSTSRGGHKMWKM